MPLEPNAKPGSEGFSKNVATEVTEGHKPVKQAVAIAYREARADALQPSPFASRLTAFEVGLNEFSARVDALASKIRTN